MSAQKPENFFIKWMIYPIMMISGLICHWLFSGYSFNPTDEGFILGYSKRVLDGQIPHLDFISIRPALSAYIHTLDFAFDKDYLFLNSRLIAWLMLALSVAIWAKALAAKDQKPTTTVFIGIIALLLVTHNYPLMAWHTIDGIFLSSLGFALMQSEKVKPVLFGSFLLGLSYLCKQNFLLLGPVFILVYAPRKAKAAFFWFLPAIIYAFFMLLFGAWDDMFIQLKTETSLLKTGIWQYISSGYLWFGIALGIGYWWLSKIQSKLTSVVYLVLIATYLGDGLYQGEAFFGPALLLTGMGCTMFLYNREVPFGAMICALMLAWSSSISIGLNSPILAITPLVVLVFYPMLSKAHLVFQLVALFIIGFGYWHGRTSYPYRDIPFEQMTADLGEVHLGLAGIKTNARTFGMLEDLENHSRGKTILLPYSGAFWSGQKEQNPISSHWTSGIELANPELLNRVIEEIDGLRGSYQVLIPKYRVDWLNTGQHPYSSYDHFPVMKHVVDHWQQTKETDWFWVYE